jgi:hypothetical protein
VVITANDPTGDYGADAAIDMVAGKVVEGPHRIKVTITLAHPIDSAAIDPTSILSFGVLLSNPTARPTFAWAEISSQHEPTFQTGPLSQKRAKRVTGSVRGNIIRIELPRLRTYTRAQFLSETRRSADSMR